MDFDRCFFFYFGEKNNCLLSLAEMVRHKQTKFTQSLNKYNIIKKILFMNYYKKFKFENFSHTTLILKKSY